MPAFRFNSPNCSKFERIFGAFQPSAWDDSPANGAFAKVGTRESDFPKIKLPNLSPAQSRFSESPAPSSTGSMTTSTSLRNSVQTLIYQLILPPERPLSQKTSTVIFSPGSDFGPAAEWPVERFQELARQISRDHEINILPAPNSPFRELSGSLTRSLSNQLFRHQLLQFLASAHFLVASDSSVPHLASFVGTPSLVIFGPNRIGIVLWVKSIRSSTSTLPCGCLLNKCPLDHRYMEELSLTGLMPITGLVAHDVSQQKALHA